MKNLVAIAAFVISTLITHAQEHKAQLLMQPANWEFERFPLPPAFAPSITYKGVEELRFAPGMFAKDSSLYFTYVFVVQLDDVVSISEAEIRDYLLNYYRGLCRVTAKDRKLVVDTTQITVSVKEQRNLPANEKIYDASADIFGVFADGAPVKLNLEIKVLADSPGRRTYLYILASPREKSDPTWNTLLQLRREFRLPG
jgi:hypothetical protein